MYRFISRKKQANWSAVIPKFKRTLLEKYIRNFCFSGFASSLLKYKSFLSLKLENSISWNIRHFFRVVFCMKLRWKSHSSTFQKQPWQHGCSPVNLLHVFRTPFITTPTEDCFLHVDKNTQNWSQSIFFLFCFYWKWLKLFWYTLFKCVNSM